MKINQKIISGFMVVGILIFVVIYADIVIYEDLSTDYRKVVGELLPGTIEAQKMEATLYHCEKYTEKYGLTGNIEHKKMAEDMLADLEEHVAAHSLYHAGLDDPKVIHIIDEGVETFTSFITERTASSMKPMSRLYFISAAGITLSLFPLSRKKMPGSLTSGKARRKFSTGGLAETSCIPLRSYTPTQMPSGNMRPLIAAATAALNSPSG
jgi:hypothetical protein